MADQDERKSIVRILDDIESRLNALKVRYDQYFSQAEKREPVKERKALERYLRHFTRRRIIQTDLRFRQVTLSSRFFSFCQYWDRIVRRIEEGKFFPEHNTGQEQQAFAKKGEEGLIDELYQQFIRLRQSCNLAGPVPAKEQFAAFIVQQRKKIAAKVGADFDVQISVVLEEGKPRIRFQVKKTS